VSNFSAGHIHELTHTGVKVAGHRGYFLTNDGVDLNLALINYGLDFLRKKTYKKIQAPFMMNQEQMAKTAQLSEFDEALYKVSRAWPVSAAGLTF
jgi:seryl-tRNA synthetase